MEQELRQIGGEAAMDDSLEIDSVRSVSLPPADGGFRAWLLLAGCFVANILIWGFSFSFGVFQEYYNSHEPFASQSSGVAAVGTTATGLMYLLMPVYFSILQRWPRLKRYSTWASLPLVTGALLGASFANTVSQLLACQGILFALGGNMLFVPTVTYLDEWFVQKKGLAIGIMWAGDGVGGVLMPPVLQALLLRFGFRTTLRALAVAMTLLMAPLLAFLKPRLPIPTSSRARPVDISFLKMPLFWTFQLFNIVQGTGYFLPTNYLPTFASSIGLGSNIGSLAIVTVNAASVVGCIFTGALIDRFSVTAVVLGVSVIASAAVLAVWGVSASVAPLFVFSFLYGLSAGSYSTTWTGMIKDVRARSVSADSNIVFGFLAAGRGIGSIVSGPLSSVLVLGGSVDAGRSALAYDGRYRLLVIFTGCTAMLGGFSFVVQKMRLLL